MTVDSCGYKLTVVVVVTGSGVWLNAEKKLCLFVVSATLVLILVNIAPAVTYGPGFDGSLNVSYITDFFLSGAAAPPETTIELAGTLGLRDWYTSDVTVTLAVTGPMPDFTTAYSYDKENWIIYSSPFVISTEGETTIYYNSTDSVGETEETKEATIQIDKTPPELYLETEIIPGEGVLVTITVIEKVSYYTGVKYSLDGENWARYPGPFLLTEVGTQKVYYQAEDAAGNSISKFEYVEVVIEKAKNPTEVNYTGDISGVYSDPINLEASLIDVLTGLPIPDKWIVFTVGTQTISAMTNSEGNASGIIVLNQPAGIYEVSASFDGDDEYLAASDSSQFLLSKEDAFAYYSGLTIIEQSDSTLTLMSTVLDDADGYWGDLTKIYVTFTIYCSSDQATASQVIDSIVVSATDLAGIGISTVEIPNLAEGEYLIVVSLNPDQNDYYWSQDSDSTIITIYHPGRESVKGAGWIEDADGNKGHFVFLVKYSCRNGLKGFIFYTLRVDNLVFFVKSTEITGFTVYENHAFFEASIIIYIYDRETKETTQLEDGYRLRIDAWDYKRRHGGDIFQIQIFDKYGIVVYDAGFDPLGRVHRGSIVIHGYRHHRHHWHHWHHRHHRHHRCYCHKMRHW